MVTMSCSLRYDRATNPQMTTPPSAYRCEQCEFELWLPICRLACSTLGLYDDSRFPGRCILVLHEHIENLASLPKSLGYQFIDDIRLAEQALRAVTGAARVNWAVLGNVEPHLHVHLVPRVGDEPFPDRSPWEHPDPICPLPVDRRGELMTALRVHLERHVRDVVPVIETAP